MATKKSTRRRSPSKKTSKGSSFKTLLLGLLLGLLIAAVLYYLYGRNERTGPFLPASGPTQRPAPKPSGQANPPEQPSHGVPAPQPNTAPATTAGSSSKPNAPHDRPVNPSQNDAGRASSAPKATEDSIGQFLQQQKAPTSAPKKAPKKSAPAEDGIAKLIHTLPADSQDPQKSAVVIDQRHIDLKQATAASPKQLQVGVFKSSQEAESFQAQLLLNGFSQINIEHGSLNNKAVSRVLLGPYTAESDLQQAIKALKAQKIKYKVIGN
ncbi:SPOR domain-containing protein [Brackiella oedipodis]|uniref:SPOR domain-containing protein n=1 Tax=Brackiella oedipodis TaxID=124225 RepID=UPI000491C360|nr:SPOR domain-containing protein [Brackiella oedipodis]